MSQVIADLQRRNVPRVNFWTLIEQNASLPNPLGKETQNYAPRFLAAALLGEYPDRFGLEIQPLSQYAHGQRHVLRCKRLLDALSMASARACCPTCSQSQLAA
ncbi:MAG TPA: hypothetical protein VFZ34_23795 [Blastocatellia bacterium]|nr:hypothetical protein [Blastocatellia bacterium]